MADSIRRKSAVKAPKRQPRFPLWLHSGTGQWTKKIKGRMFYFGTNQDEALARYSAHLDELKNPSPAKVDPERATVKTLANVFLTHKKSAVEIGELTARSFRDYLKTCEGMTDALGKATAVDSISAERLLAYRRELAKRLGPVSLSNEINRCRVVFNFAFENGLIDKPVRFGEFKRAKKSALRKSRAEKGSRLFEPADLRQIIEAADVQLKAWSYWQSTVDSAIPIVANCRLKRSTWKVVGPIFRGRRLESPVDANCGPKRLRRCKCGFPSEKSQ